MTLKQEARVPLAVNGIDGQTKLDNIGRWNHGDGTISRKRPETAANFPLEKQKWPAGSFKKIIISRPKQPTTVQH